VNTIGRRQFLLGSAALLGTAAAGAEPSTAGSAPAGSSRLIAVEEAFAPPRYFAEYLKIADTVDTPVSRYLKMYYEKPEVVRQLSDFAVRLADMDRYSVDMEVVSLTAPGVQAFDAELGTELAILANDMLAEQVALHPTRLAGLAAVAPQSPEGAAREIQRAMTSLGLSGVIINSHTHGEFLDDPKYAPIFEAAVQYGAPIYLHPTFPPDSMLAPYNDYGMMGALWGFQAECSLHVVRMILSGLFDRYPRLRIVLGHLGEGIPYWLGRLDNRYQNIRRRGGFAALGMTPLERLPSDYFKANFYVTTSGMNDHQVLEYCVERLGAERVMFAIDYPYERTAEAVDFIRTTALAPAQLDQVTHLNAQRLFGIAPLAGSDNAA